jgi:hypothetical protein
MMMPHFYVAGVGKERGVPAAGSALFVASNGVGGQVAEVDTDAEAGDLLIVGFNPAKQLHWVDSRGGEGIEQTRQHFFCSWSDNIAVNLRTLS